MPTAAELDETIDDAFAEFVDQSESITYRRIRLGAFDPSIDRHAETADDTALVAIAPGSSSRLRMLAGNAGKSDKFSTWYVKGSDLRAKEPLTQNDLLVVDSKEVQIMTARRIPEAGGVTALYIFEVENPELTTDA